MPSPATHQDLCVPFPRDRPSRQLYVAAVLAEMAYVHQEPELIRAMGAFLGYDNFQWIQTPGNLTVNFLVGAAPNGIVVAFSGTETFTQIITYCAALFNEFVPSDFPFSVHKGFYEIWTRTQNQLNAAIPANCLHAPITLIGHSLGGAIAQLWAYRFFRNFQYPVVNLITFGSPAIGARASAALVGQIPRTMVRYINDLMPFLPPNFSFAPRLGLVPALPIVLFFEYSRIQPQLTLKPRLDYALEEFPFNEWDWRRAGRVIQAMVNPGYSASHGVELSAIATDHAMRTAYLPWLVGYLSGGGDTSLFPLDRILAQIYALEQPGADVTEIPPGALDALIRSITPPPPNVLPTPLPPTFSTPETVQAGNAVTIPGPIIHQQTTVDPRIIPFSTVPVFTSQITGPVDHSVAGGAFRPFWLYRGQDRRMLETLQKLLNAISLRDDKVAAAMLAGSPKPGVFIIDPHDAALTNAVQLISQQIDLLLGLQQQDLG
jgi:pimeloyl-ACP methyl ester carboxylesterase